MPWAHRDYTVAWICPMGLELAPVKAMLDHVHPNLPTQRDHNIYTLGDMEGHNVVIAVLPETGTNAAAVVAMQLLNDFPAIRFGLLVGIGGGVPDQENEERDIRLGDVVVSKPTDTFGGVVQYDLGKETNYGFQRTGLLNKPPPILRAAVQQLVAQHEMEESQIVDHLETMMEKWPKMKHKYTYPGAHQDQLYQSDYHHQGGTTCNVCDERHMIIRDERPHSRPYIHYGTIASANKVVKNASEQQRLKTDMDVLCVEMEAAGLMNSFPCLVIRGICDYADSHKNKKWQPYAAATAAGYMKELLSVIPSQDVARVTPATAAMKASSMIPPQPVSRVTSATATMKASSINPPQPVARVTSMEVVEMSSERNQQSLQRQTSNTIKPNLASPRSPAPTVPSKHISALHKPLYRAIQQPSLSQVLDFLRNGLSARILNSALLYACHVGNVEIVRQFLEHGAHVESYSEQYPEGVGTSGSALIVAALWHHSEVVEILLDKGAKVNETHTGLSGRSALMEAIYWHRISPLSAVRFLETIAILLERGADPNSSDVGGHTALWYCVSNEEMPLRVLDLLLESGADVREWAVLREACSLFTTTKYLEWLEKQGVLLGNTSDDSEPPFMWAIKNGSEEKLKFFLDRDVVDLEWTNDAGQDVVGMLAAGILSIDSTTAQVLQLIVDSRQGKALDLTSWSEALATAEARESASATQLNRPMRRTRTLGILRQGRDQARSPYDQTQKLTNWESRHLIA
ncbi:hypothetical protein LTR84_006763 [Exophiala bonariae]|uniref:Nucleoside phosphorylase domain-containing protein n=1 Tax=Exophiala bonariae TaxID=1690606 RepID=A0AAV9N040_9EURO|nr:hypothetical protein LTR84_006763 [Exophiala bonariae]